MTRPGFLRFLPVWPLLFAALLVLAWQQRLDLVTWVLEKQLALDGIGNLKVEPASLDTEHIALDSLSFDLETGGYLLAVSVHDAHLTFAPGDGLLPRPGALYIDSLDAGITVESAQLSEPVDLEQIHRQLSEIIDRSSRLAGPAVPPVRINRFSLRGESGRALVEDVSLEFQPHTDFLDLVAERNDQVLKLTLRSDGMLLQVGTEQGGAAAPLILELEARNDQPSLSARIEPAALSDWIESARPGTTAEWPRSIATGPVHCDASLVADRGRMLARFEFSGESITWEDTSLSRWRLEFPLDLAINTPLDSLMEIPLPLETGVQFTAHRLQLGELTLADLHFEPRGVILPPFQGPGIRLSAESVLRLAAVNAADWRLEDLVVAPALSHDTKDTRILEDFAVAIGRLQLGDQWIVHELDATATSAAAVGLAPGAASGLGPGDWNLTLRAEDRSGLAIRILGSLEIEEAGPDRLAVTLDLDRPAVDWPGNVLPETENIRVSLGYRSGRLTFDGVLSLVEERVSLVLGGYHDWELDGGQVTLRTDGKAELTRLQRIADNWRPGWVAGLELESGSGMLDATLEWQQGAPGLTMGLAVDDAGGGYGEFRFTGLVLEGRWRLLPELASERATKLKIDSLQYGIELSNIAASLVLEETEGTLPGLRLPWFRGTLFDGQLSGGPVSIDLNDPQTEFSLLVQDLDLARVVETQGVDALSAQGRLDGALPVRLSAEGLRIENGRLSDRDGGFIRYAVSDEQAATLDNPLTDVVIRALRDFEYRVMDAQADYHPDGTLLLQIHLEGTSPTLESGRPIHLNINSEQNVLSLLRSLDYAAGLNQALDERFNDRLDAPADPASR